MTSDKRKKGNKAAEFSQNYTRYQSFSEENLTFDPEVYKSTIKEVLSLVCPRLNKKPQELKVLDVGSGIGGYSFEFAKHVKMVVGVEPEKRTHIIAQEIKKRKRVKNVYFYHNLIEDFKSNEKFDLIICLATLEHMPQAEKSLKKMFSLLREGGYIYMTAPNKLWWYDYHYRLPFIMWLPLPLANLYVRVMKRGESFEDASYARTYWGVKRLFDRYTNKYEFVLPDPQAAYLALGEQSTAYKIMKNTGILLIKHFSFMWAFSIGFIVLAQKSESK